jgi:hypothetical protein
MMKKESKMADGTNRKQSGENTPNPSNNTALSRRNILLAGTSLAAATAINAIDRTQVAQAQQPQQPSGRKPNILIIWGDDIGYWNVSAYNHGMMGYKTPNIERIAKEGAMFTDWYGQQSCTAGRSTFIRARSARACSRWDYRAQRKGYRKKT